MKVKDLDGPMLDMWVARANYKDEEYISYEPLIIDGRCVVSMNGQVDFPFSPTSDWAQGGQIIERKRITIEAVADEWRACPWSDSESLAVDKYQYGPTALKAAMRCYVADTFGEEVEG